MTDLTKYVTPSDPLVRELSSLIAATDGSTTVDLVNTTWRFISGQMQYREENGLYHRYPVEALDSRWGDCKSFAALMTSILRNYLGPDQVFVALGDLKGQGHAWVRVVIDGQAYVIDPTIPSWKGRWLPEEKATEYAPEEWFNDVGVWSK